MLMPLKTSEPSGTLQSICTRTFPNLTEYLHRNPAQPHRLSALKPSEIVPGICSGTLRNLNRYLHQNPPEPQQVSSPERSRTLWNLARNLVLKLHRIAPELIWAKDPIAKFCCSGKKMKSLSRARLWVCVGVSGSCRGVMSVLIFSLQQFFALAAATISHNCPDSCPCLIYVVIIICNHK